MSSPRARGGLFLAALLLIAGAAAFRYQGPLLARLYARRLASDSVAPDDHVRAARALAARDRARPPESLTPEAKLRFLVATGFSITEAGPLAKPGADATQEVTNLLAEERRLAGLAGTLAREHPEVAAALAERATDAVVRMNALKALALGADARALPAARAGLRDRIGDVRIAAFTAGDLITRRAADAAAREDFLGEAARSDGIGTRALDAAEYQHDPRAIPVLIAYLESPYPTDAEKVAATDHIRRLAGEAKAASAPPGTDPAAWRAWWSRVKGG